MKKIRKVLKKIICVQNGMVQSVYLVSKDITGVKLQASAQLLIHCVKILMRLRKSAEFATKDASKTQARDVRELID